MTPYEKGGRMIVVSFEVSEVRFMVCYVEESCYREKSNTSE